MSETNSQLARRWFHDVWTRGREETVREMLHPDIVGQMEGGMVRSPEDFLEARREMLAALPDLRVEVQAVVGEGDEVAVRWAANATGPAGPVSFRGITWLVFEGGRIIRGWDSWNQALLMQQLAAPPMTIADPGSRTAGA
ncbi:MAG TPA: ester cyclase [Thermoanaerobaculia bacterium]|jgi:predicted ester cyclase|nr:ester cyclase [Thermoanaerobaculia bacterium]